ncbi:MAG: four helix bundle protein [Gemmatimonadales bacterium]
MAIPPPGSSPFRQLIVWQRSMDLAVRVHQLTRCVPGRFRFSLAEQMNRAAISVPSNIAGGAGATLAASSANTRESLEAPCESWRHHWCLAFSLKRFGPAPRPRRA